MANGSAISEKNGAHPANSARTLLSITGMTCSGCQRAVLNALTSLEAVDRAVVSLDKQSAEIEWKNKASPQIEQAIESVREAGYEAEISADSTAASTSPSFFHGWFWTVLVGAIGTVPMMICEWTFGLGEISVYRWIAFCLASPVQFIGGWRFYRGAWSQLKHGRSNMDTLVSLGSSTAFFYSLYLLLSRTAGHVFFMESAAIITLVGAGHWVEAIVSSRAAFALRALLELAPAQARKVTEQGHELLVSVASLLPGDLILLKPGDRVPADATLLEGESSVDESMLTGESMPVDKSVGMKIFTGTQNLNGSIKARVDAVGAQSSLAQIIAVVERAQNSRANIQKLGDRISSIFVPGVVLIALATAIWWGVWYSSAHSIASWFSAIVPVHAFSSSWAAAIYHCAAVLIIACPCAMGLATPAAIMAAANQGARMGILIRDGDALEKSGCITSIVFDKTGTLTTGKIDVASTVSFAEEESELSLKVAVELARRSNHPVSQAVAQIHSPWEPLQLENWREIRGRGIEAEVHLNGQKRLFRLGSLNWMKELRNLTPAALEMAEENLRAGATVLFLADGAAVLRIFVLADKLKRGARQVLEDLRQKGYQCYMVTGDNRLAALSVAAQLGLKEKRVMAETSPEGKAEMIRKLQEAGERVAFVGDGINDAPALKQSNLGFAMAQATDVAREAADIVLLQADLAMIPQALDLAKKTLRIIKQNLFWAFFYNALGIPLAAIGVVSPVLSALAMGLSDLIVIGNALRLRQNAVKTER